MKKTIAIILTIALISISTAIYAATPSYNVEITSQKTEVKQAEEVKVTVKIKNATGMDEGIYAYLAKIEYDTEIFEKLTQESFSGEGAWSTPTYNESNGKIVADSNSGITTEGTIFTITLKVKETATVGKTGTIKITEFIASEGNEDIEASGDASVTIKVGQTITNNNNNNDNNGNNNNNNNNNNDNDNNGNNNNNNNNDNDNNGNDNNNNDNGNNNSSNGTTNNGTNNGSSQTIKDSGKEDTTKSPSPVPQTGETSVVIIAIIIVVTIGVFSYIKYKKSY